MADLPGQGALTLSQAAGLLGGYRWIEHRLFELTGAWAAQTSAPAVQLHLDEVSSQHAWHADLWADRLPVLDGIDPEALTRPIGTAGALVSRLATEATASDDRTGTSNGTGEGRLHPVPLLAGLYRVLVPRLIATYDLHLSRAVPVTDGPTIRALRLVLADETESWRAGEALLQGIMTGPKEVAAAAETQARLESLAVADGVGRGLVPWPADPSPREG